MISSHFSKSFKDTFSLVIDVTYNCNARCLYCQWGSDKTIGRIDQPDTNILIPQMTIKSLGSERIVFSGGEPLIRNDLDRIISYYSKFNVKSIAITNGLLLNQQRLNSLTRAGLTGITFSIDGISEEIALTTRGFTKENCKIILDNLKNTLRQRDSKRFEVGINTVVSKANLDINVMRQFIEFCNDLEIDWIKFNPLFDDGFVSKNAPWLILQKDDAHQIRHIGNEIVRNCKIMTNPIDFWETVALTLEGKKLLGSSCGLDKGQPIAIRGKLKFCFWIDDPIYGPTISLLSPNDVKKIH
jgi:MoaA/NifB/PqqE/SkfB family radical SAM enzyme